MEKIITSTSILYIFIILLHFNQFNDSCSVFTVSSSTRTHLEYLMINSSDIPIINSSLPIVINTWATSSFVQAASKAWDVLKGGGSALDAVENGCTMCETLQCDGTVGYGGSPDEKGETTLDAMIMDGETHNVGAVGALRRVKSAISVARQVMERTDHTLLVGSQATDFALMMGFHEENLTTSTSESVQVQWKEKNCQPNFWHNVIPNPENSCGPYTPVSLPKDRPPVKKSKMVVDERNHDTIGMIAIDWRGHIAGGTSTNGASHKIPGRVGDSPIPGSGAYVDKNVGGASATGDGDVMMRFMPSLLAVEYMRLGMTPDDAANLALERIVTYYPTFSGAVVSMNINGTYGASCHNLPGGEFHFSVGNQQLNGVQVQTVPCIDGAKTKPSIVKS